MVTTCSVTTGGWLDAGTLMMTSDARVRVARVSRIASTAMVSRSSCGGRGDGYHGGGGLIHTCRDRDNTKRCRTAPESLG